MPFIPVHDYKPNLLLRHRHANTMYPYLFRKVLDIGFERHRFDTSDGDFIHLDWLYGEQDKLVILCHGLEGSSDSKYIQYTSQLLHSHGWTVCAINYRYCSGEPNHTAKMYHSGFTQDLHEVIETYGSKYDQVALVGFSLGGNMVMKYLGDGEHPLTENIKRAVAISAPIDLSGSSKAIGKWYNYAYENRFLVTLRAKMIEKHRQFPEVVNIENLKKVTSLVSFDEYFTGPLHGFEGAEDYYSQCNSLQFIENIEVPTLLINALDDPFLSEKCYPIEEAKNNDIFHLKAPKFGGHVGFTTFGQSNYWNEFEILNFIST